MTFGLARRFQARDPAWKTKCRCTASRIHHLHPPNSPSRHELRLLRLSPQPLISFSASLGAIMSRRSGTGNSADKDGSSPSAAENPGAFPHVAPSTRQALTVLQAWKSRRGCSRPMLAISR